MKNVLVIAYYFPPAGGPPVQRTLQHVRHLRDYGWNPIVLTVPPEEYSEPGAPLRGSVDESLLNELPKDLKVVRVPSGQPFWLFRLLARMRLDYVRELFLGSTHGLDSAFTWNRRAVRAAMQLARETRIDAIYVSLRPNSSAFIGTRLKKSLRVPLVLDFRDPWSQYFLATFPTWLHYKFTQVLERWIVRRADHIITISPTARSNLLAWCQFLAPEKVTCIPNGFCAHDFPESSPLPKKDDVFRILYSGTFCGGPEDSEPRSRSVVLRLWRSIRRILEYTPRSFDRIAHSPRFLLEAMSELVAQDAALRRRLRFVHIGPTSSVHKDYLRHLGLQDSVEFLGFVSHADAIRRMQEADALFFCLADSLTDERNDCVPQKTYEYIGSGKPILALVPPGDAHDLFVQSGVAQVCPPRDISAIKSAIIRLVTLPSIPLPDEKFRSRFKRDQLTAELATILNDRTAANGLGSGCSHGGNTHTGFADHSKTNGVS